MKRSILFSLMIITAAVVLATGAGTFAYFSDNGNSTANTFTSGTLDVQLSNDGSGIWSDNVSGTWATPAGWAPGNTFEEVLKFRNVGSVAAHSGLVDFQYGSCGPGGNIFPKVQVLEYWESVDGGTTWYINNIPALASASIFDANGDTKLSLQELIDGDSMTPGSQSPSPYDLSIYTPTGTAPLFTGGVDNGAWGNAGGPTFDVLPFGNTDILPANQAGVYAMKMKFKFMEDAGNAYQGLSCTMNINFKFVQVPGPRPWSSLAGY